MSFGRALRHLFAPPWLVRRAFPQSALDAIEAAVKASERRSRGEIRFAVEGALDFLPVLRGFSAHARALEVFSIARVWDTEENIGVLLYLQLADREIEIVADRAIAKVVPQSEWEAICARMEQGLGAGRFDAAVIAGIAEIGALLATHFPAGSENPDELPDRPVVL